jgi:hypothetical protein
VEESWLYENGQDGEGDPEAGHFQVSKKKQTKKQNKKNKTNENGKKKLIFFCFRSRAFNAVKATSRAHDKKVALNTCQNYKALQSTKPWASHDDVSTFNRGRGGPAPRGRGMHLW